MSYVVLKSPLSPFRTANVFTRNLDSAGSGVVMCVQDILVVVSDPAMETAVVVWYIMDQMEKTVSLGSSAGHMAVVFFLQFIQTYKGTEHGYLEMLQN
jgi:hypothetical protein